MKSVHNKKSESVELNLFEKDLLLNIYENDRRISQKDLAKRFGRSIGLINKLLHSLKQKGFLDDQCQPTEKADALLRNSSPKNAVILAAGLGMRMVPINLSVSKAFLEVNSEPLIERLIRQLKEIGIDDISVVVGFMKDSFEYLIDEFGVKLIYAADYARTNNLHSLAAAVDQIDNTYIIPCDIWCKENPFRKNESRSWYMVSDLPDHSSDVRINRKMELVKAPEGSDGNKMIGIAYLTGKQAKIIREKLRIMIKDRNNDDRFWEEALFSQNRMIVHARIVDPSDIIEIDTYEQLRELDSGSNQLKSDALETIAAVLHCKPEGITEIKVLKKGMTNRSFLFKVSEGKNAGKYIMRIPGEGTDQLVDRKKEAQVYDAIKGLQFCDDPIYLDPDKGYKITRYIEGVRCCDPMNIDDVRLCMRKLRDFHNFRIDGKPLSVGHTFDLFEQIDLYESLWNGQPSIYRDHEKTKENCKKLILYIEKYKEPFQLTHIDAVPDNFLFEPQTEKGISIQLTDWEYAAMQDRHVDIAMFAIYSLYDKRQIDQLIDIYFEEDGGCDRNTRAKIYAYISVCGLLWSDWCEYKRNLGVEFGEYSLYQYRYAKEYFRYACQLME